MAKLFIILALIGVVAADKVTYEKHSLFEITPTTEEHVQILRNLYETEKGLEFAESPSKVDKFVSVATPPELRKHLEQILEKYEIYGEAVEENLQEAIDQRRVTRGTRNVRDRLTWSNFQLLEDIYDWFDELGSTFPNTITVINTGESYEGRNITGIKISRNSGRQAFVLQGGLQGADWLSPATLTFIANEIIFAPQPETRQLSLDFDWYIFPVTNPDGYKYSQERVRSWVKNRRPTRDGHIGVDLSRNWNYNWGGNGGSFELAADDYVGRGPFSEPETRSFSIFMDSIRDSLFAYLSFGGFGQRLLLPFANTTEHLSNYDQMVVIGRRAMGSLSVRHGTMYSVGTAAEVLATPLDGNAGDWVKIRFNTPIVATYLLRGEGFIIHPNQLLPNAQEVFDSITALLREARFINFL